MRVKEPITIHDQTITAGPVETDKKRWIRLNLGLFRSEENFGYRPPQHLPPFVRE